MARDLACSKAESVLENALLRQRLIALQRRVKRLTFTWRDRAPCAHSRQTAKLESGSDDRPTRYVAAPTSRAIPKGVEAQVKAQREGGATAFG